MDVQYTVDRIHGDVVILVDDAGAVCTVSMLDLPDAVDGTSVLRVQLDDENEPDWSSAVIEDEEPTGADAR